MWRTRRREPRGAAGLPDRYLLQDLYFSALGYFEYNTNERLNLLQLHLARVITTPNDQLQASEIIRGGCPKERTPASTDVYSQKYATQAELHNILKPVVEITAMQNFKDEIKIRHASKQLLSMKQKSAVATVGHCPTILLKKQGGPLFHFLATF